MLAIMAGWTAVTIYLYPRAAGWLAWLVAADVAVAAALVLSTRLVESSSLINSGAPTLPAFWAGVPVLACAVAGGPLAGLAGGAVISLADLGERGALPQSTFNSTVLLLIAGGVGGYVVQLALEAEAAVASAARHEAAIAERERIARGIHDSVLQVLALVSRRGRNSAGKPPSWAAWRPSRRARCAPWSPGQPSPVHRAAAWTCGRCSIRSAGRR